MRHAATPESGCYSIITYLLMLLANGKLFYNQNSVATALGSGSQFTTINLASSLDANVSAALLMRRLALKTLRFDAKLY
ncbi:hypothetical protein [Nostoc sp.]|uniref:hypothetical protein n=1 Tax=Nostoc sp. TaxID=1180 RepID=UPI002FF56392